MKSARWRAVRSCVLAGPAMLAVVSPALPAAAAPAHPVVARRTALPGSLAPSQARTHPAGSISPASRVQFSLVLRLRRAGAAKAFARAVSSPGSPEFHRYLSDAQWASRYGPAPAQAAAAVSWLRGQGLRTGPVPRDRLYVPAEGSAAAVGRAFGVTLRRYDVNGHLVRLAASPLTIPSSLASSVSGVVGVNQYLATAGPGLAGRAAAARPAAPGGEPPPPPGFRNPQPCSSFWGQKTDTSDAASLYAPYTGPLPYDICGYKPAQLRGAYGLARPVATGDRGTGVTVAIVDAYDSPTLLRDAQRYAARNDPANPLRPAQFTNVVPALTDDEAICGGSTWRAEQTLDVEAVHAMAPGAGILYIGAPDCQDPGLLAALHEAVTSGASVVSGSWGQDLGDLFVDPGTKAAFDDTFLLAGATGVSVLFAAGDGGDNFADFGMTVPNYPATSPYVTAVGGTALEIGARRQRAAEYGWSAATQVLCTPAATTCGSAVTPAGPLHWGAGSAGGTSYTYPQPFYQAGVVPPALALRNQALFGPQPMRTVPDISMDADTQTGMLIGLTQAFPGGTFYGQYKVGGTSLAAPLLAGVVADADQRAAMPLGFLNPEIYRLASSEPTALTDITPPASPSRAATVRADFADFTDAAHGYLISARVLSYQGPETYCDGTGNCATRQVTLTTAPGFDGMTGLGSVGPRFIGALVSP